MVHVMSVDAASSNVKSLQADMTGNREIVALSSDVRRHILERPCKTLCNVTLHPETLSRMIICCSVLAYRVTLHSSNCLLQVACETCMILTSASMEKALLILFQAKHEEQHCKTSLQTQRLLEMC